jgi:hypothetical protein
MKSLAVSMLTVLSLAPAAWAAQPLITDDTGTQGKGAQQLEWAHSSERATQGLGRSRSLAGAWTYTLGATDQADVFVTGSYLGLRPASGPSTSGWSHLTLGAKWRLWELESSQTSLALKPEWLLPVSPGREARELGVGRSSCALTLIATQELPFGALHLNVQAGRERYRDSQDNERSLRYSAATLWDVAPGWRLALDLGQQTVRSAQGAEVRARFVEIGTIYSPSKSQDWALGLIRSTDNDKPAAATRTLTGGWTYRF